MTAAAITKSMRACRCCVLQVSKIEVVGRDVRVKHETLSMRSQMLEDQVKTNAQVT